MNGTSNAFTVWKERLSNVLLFVGAFVVALLSNIFLFQSYQVDGQSMQPTLHNGDRLVIQKTERTMAFITRKSYIPKRGEIIVFHKPNGSSDQLIKRVVGLPGDRVVVKNSVVTIYNTEKPDGFNPDAAEYGKELSPTYGNVDVLVGKDEVFVMGDNRVQGASLDSRSIIGNIPARLIVGKLTARYAPFGDARTF